MLACSTWLIFEISMHQRSRGNWNFVRYRNGMKKSKKTKEGNSIRNLKMSRLWRPLFDYKPHQAGKALGEDTYEGKWVGRCRKSRMEKWKPNGSATEDSTTKTDKTPAAPTVYRNQWIGKPRRIASTWRTNSMASSASQWKNNLICFWMVSCRKLEELTNQTPEPSNIGNFKLAVPTHTENIIKSLHHSDLLRLAHLLMSYLLSNTLKGNKTLCDRTAMGKIEGRRQREGGGLHSKYPNRLQTSSPNLKGSWRSHLWKKMGWETP